MACSHSDRTDNGSLHAPLWRSEGGAEVSIIRHDEVGDKGVILEIQSGEGGRIHELAGSEERSLLSRLLS